MTSPDIVTLHRWALHSGLFEPLARRRRKGHRDLGDTDRSDRTDEIDVPVPLIGGHRDKRMAPASHAPFLTEPELVAPAIGEFGGHSAHA